MRCLLEVHRVSVADTSLMAYRRVVALGITAEQQLRIVKALSAGVPLTRTEISEFSGIRIPSVCGAVNLLVKKGILVELPWRACRVTRYQAHPLVLADVQPTAPLDVQPAAPPVDPQLPLL